ncbi:MAG: 23S rRNA (uracil(1939)-C(5))-methyltransferase RlmD [Lachnospira sp.]|nr:23S rRNA (uracil(1939)-C(5))-methyltransferase RlmD [Lachnospira sp.]
MAGKYNEQDKSISCSVCDVCGGCSYTGVAYEEELKIKHKYVSDLFKGITECEPVTGMYRPIFYRNKVHGVVGYNKEKKIVTGIYQEGTHKLIPVDTCMIEDEESDKIMNTLCKLFNSFKYIPYNEDSKRGFMRHVLIRKGFSTKEIMVVLVTSDVAFPSKNAFIKELLKAHPQITTIVQNINNARTSMVLGKRNIVLAGKGYIEDVLCGCRFRISAETFYQINPAQTEKLYKAAIKAAGIKKQDTVIDAYCGVGTIGIVAASAAGKVIGVELNAQSVADAEVNAKLNNVKNISFVCGDAGEFLVEYAKKGKADVVIMDPPRSGSTPEFINSLLKIRPERIVYVSCDPSTQVRDIKPLIKGGYKVTMCKPYDMFPHTSHCENLILLSR